MTHFSKRYDAVIVGGRVAGAATAMLLARSGARVLMIDRDRSGTDTMSTHALMRSAVMQLQDWGLLGRIIAADTPPVRRTVFHYGPETLDVDIRPAFDTDALYAPRRTVLDDIIVRAAAEAGAQVVHGTNAAELIRGTSGQVAGVRLRGPGGNVTSVKAGIVIGADGRRSWVGRQVNAANIRQAPASSAIVYLYATGIPNMGYEWYYTAGAGAGVIPTNGGQSVVFLAVPPADLHAAVPERTAQGFIRSAIARIPALAPALAGAHPVSHPVVFGGASGFMRDAHGPGWALVGDAGYFKDPLTANGISDALRDAAILSGAIIAGRPQDYVPLRNALSDDFFRITGEIASFGWTLDSLKQKHIELNRAMKVSQSWIAEELQCVRAA